MSTHSKKKVEYRRNELVVHIPDTRGVHVSPWGRGNLKLGPSIYTYSKLPGLPSPHGGTCPGATDTCLRHCYAFRVWETPLVWQMWTENTHRARPPAPPDDAKIVRWHVSGDFVDETEIDWWTWFATHRQKVRFFGYTRSWRVPELLPELEKLRALDNVQLFASVDASAGMVWSAEPAPDGWRRAFLAPATPSKAPDAGSYIDGEGQRIGYYVCPETTGRKPSCESCNYCILGTKGDVVFTCH